MRFSACNTCFCVWGLVGLSLFLSHDGYLVSSSNFTISSIQPFSEKLVNLTRGQPRNWLLEGERKMKDALKFHNFAVHALLHSQPVFFGRTGVTEARVLARCSGAWEKMFDNKKEDIKLQTNALTHSNIFPNTVNFIFNEWCPTYMAAAADMDIEIAWAGRSLAHKTAFQLHDITCLESWNWSKPWTRLLRGKRVLVVTAFPETLASQYEKRKLLFPHHPEVLPDFEKLLVVGSPLPQWEIKKYNESYVPKHRTLEDHSPTFDGEYRFSDPDGSWLLEVESLKYRINKTVEESGDFDVLLVGAGSYSIPVARFCSKTLGKHPLLWEEHCKCFLESKV